MNVRSRVGEIDLIMADQRTAIVVEVRQRRQQGFGSAVDSITLSKRQKIYRTALRWWTFIGRHSFTHLRFDVVVFEQNRQPLWIASAWTDPSWI